MWANAAVSIASATAFSPADAKIGHDALAAFIRNAASNGETVTRSRVIKVTDHPDGDGSRTVRIVATVEGLGTSVFDVEAAPEYSYSVVGARRVG